MKYNILFLFMLASALESGAAPRSPSPWETVMPDLTPHRLRCSGVFTLDEDSLHIYDAVKFSPHLSFNFTAREISGYVLIELTTHEFSLDRIDFRFTHSLTIDSVWANGAFATTYTSEGDDSIQVLLSPSLQPDDTVMIGIAYHGNPEIADSWGGFRWANATFWQPEIAFSMGDGLNLEPPPANFTWIPSYADPNDKALWEAWFHVPTGKTVSTNGIRVDSVNNGDSTTTWHYRLDQSVSTYLFFISASTYVIQTQRGADPLIENFVYPSRESQAEVHFSNVPTVLDSFVSRFGPYPFARMGYNMTRIGDMEHATCVSHIDVVVNANHAYDWLLFHEMSHMWWGDWVTCGDWRDLWLNEGFATFCEALGMEALGGQDAYMNYIVTDLFDDALSTNENFSIYDPDYYWGETVYDKGGCVMHMLRFLLGDSSFFSALREFGQEHAYGTAVTPDWQAKLEQHYGDSLGWFFQPWVYGTRYPQYHIIVQWGEFSLVTIEQVQPTQTLFRMPLDLQFVDIFGDTNRVMVWNEAVTSQSWPVDSWPVSVVLDPDNKVLKTVSYTILSAEDNSTEVPHEFRLKALYPNPFNPATTVTFELPHASPVQLRVFNLLGREVKQTDFGSMHAGTHSVSFNGSDLPSGIFLFRVDTNLGSLTAKAVLLK